MQTRTLEQLRRLRPRVNLHRAMAEKRRLEARQESGRLHVSGLLVPWHSEITVGGVKESWAPGALDRQMSIPEARGHVRLDLLHTSHAEAGFGERLEPFGRLVESDNRRAGQYGDFRLDRSGEARQAWVLVDDGILDGFSVTFVSIDPPHSGEGGSRSGKRGQGRIREAIIDTTAITDTPLYRAARATAEARQRHPLLDEISPASEAPDTVPPEYIAFYRNRQRRRTAQ